MERLQKALEVLSLKSVLIGEVSPLSLFFFFGGGAVWLGAALTQPALGRPAIVGRALINQRSFAGSIFSEKEFTLQTHHYVSFFFPLDRRFIL